MRRGSAKERRRLMDGIVMEELGRRIEICKIRKRNGSARTVFIVKMGKFRDRIVLLEKGWEIRRN